MFIFIILPSPTMCPPSLVWWHVYHLSLLFEVILPPEGDLGTVYVCDLSPRRWSRQRLLHQLLVLGSKLEQNQLQIWDTWAAPEIMPKTRNGIYFDWANDLHILGGSFSMSMSSRVVTWGKVWTKSLCLVCCLTNSLAISSTLIKICFMRRLYI